AAADRLHEDVARSVFRLLDDEAEVGDQNQACILNFAGIPAPIGIGTSPWPIGHGTETQNEQAMPAGSVQQIRTEINAVVAGLPWFCCAEVAFRYELLDDLVFKISSEVGIGILKLCRTQVMQLIRQQAANRDLH